MEKVECSNASCFDMSFTSLERQDWLTPSLELLSIDETQNGSGPAPESANGNLVGGS